MYRSRSALRDLGKVFGLTPEESGNLAKVMQWWDGGEAMPERLREALTGVAKQAFTDDVQYKSGIVTDLVVHVQ